MTSRLRALALGLIVAYLVVAPLLFSVAAVESFEFPKVLLLRTLSLALLALGALAMAEWAVEGQLALRVKAASGAALRDPILLGAGAWLLAGTLSAAASMSPHVSLHGAHESFSGLVTLASYGVLFAASRILLRSTADLRLALVAALAAGAGATTYGLFQLFGSDPIGWEITRRSGGLQRIASTMGNPNSLGAYLAMLFPAGACLAIQERRRGALGVPVAIALVLSAGLVVSFATLSRGVMVAYGAATGVFAFGWWRSGQRIGAIPVAGAMLALVLAGSVFFAGTEIGGRYGQRAISRLEQSLERDLRIEFWTAAVSMYRSQPVFGVGLDSYQLAFPQHARPSFRRRVPEATPGRAHNELLHTAATQGTVGVVAGFIFLSALVAGWLRALRTASNGEERALLIAVGAGLAALLARNLVSFTVVGLGGLACVLAGALAGLAYDKSLASGAPSLSRRGARAAIGLGIAVAGVTFLVATRLASAGSATGAVIAACALCGAVGLVGFGLLPTHESGAGSVAERLPANVRRGLRLLLTALAALGFLAAVAQTVVRPAAADFLARQAKELMTSGRPDVALPLFARAVRLDPAREIFWIDLGIAHYRVASKADASESERVQQLRKAIAAHLRSSELVPVHVVNPANVARGLAELGTTASSEVGEGERSRLRAAAYERFDAALELDPFARAVYFDATKAARGFRDEVALARYAAAWSQRYPDHGQARAQLGIAAMMRGDWLQAETELLVAAQGRWARALSDEVGNWVNLASTQLRLGKALDAHSSSETALGLVPRYLPALRTRALAHEALAGVARDVAEGGQGDVLRAREHSRRASEDWAVLLAISPDDEEAREALVRLSSRWGNVDENSEPHRPEGNEP